jgi:hypothetical protein
MYLRLINNTTCSNSVLYLSVSLAKHEILLTKLHFYGIQISAANWFNFYIIDRRQKAETISSNNNSNFCSKWGMIEHGVPQGSILVPLLFIIYLNDLPPKISIVSEPITFADGTSVIISVI